jgi:hypothetical protein
LEIGWFESQSLKVPEENRDDEVIGEGDVRYWPLADVPSCTAYVRFREKADMGRCTANVCF